MFLWTLPRKIHYGSHNDLIFNYVITFMTLLAVGLLYPRPEGSGDIAMSLASVSRLSVRPYVRLSVNIFVSAQSLLYRVEYFDDTSQLCRVGHNDVSRIEMRALALILFELFPFDALLLCIFVSALQLEYPLENNHDTSQLCRTCHDDVSVQE